MFFKKKKSEIKCKNCNSGIDDKFSFCPYCGRSLLDSEREMKDFGMLGRNDFDNSLEKNPMSQFGLTDKLINSIMSSVMKSMDKQVKNMVESDMQNLDNSNARIEQLPNGIKISIGMPSPQARQQTQRPKQAPKKQITEAQLEKMSKLPREEAKTKIRRLSDKVIYEISASGIASPEDVLISKLESGYEIKAIGKNKVYVNSIPISLPLRGFSFDDKKLSVEFKINK